MILVLLLMTSLDAGAATMMFDSSCDELIVATTKTLPRFHDDCRRAAREKIESYLSPHGGKMVDLTLAVTEVDARARRAGYLWFSALATMPDGSVKRVDTMTQKPAWRPCF